MLAAADSNIMEQKPNVSRYVISDLACFNHAVGVCVNLRCHQLVQVSCWEAQLEGG